MQQYRNNWCATAQRWIGPSAIIALAMLLAACSGSTTTSTTPPPGPLPRGQWLRPVFGGTSPITVSSVGFAEGDQRVGYACTATLPTTPTATPTPATTDTPTPTATTLTPTPTLSIPGQPTATVPATFANTFWTTNNGGQGWTTASLPTETNQDFVCPVSAIVAPDLANPSDVFLLAAHGAVDIENPTTIQPGKVRFELWRSQDGAQHWQELTVPTVPNPLTPVSLSPYHLIIQVQGSTLVLATNYSGANFLFVSADGGKTWRQSPGVQSPTNTGPVPATLQFAGFAAGPNGSLLALAHNGATPATANPVDLWQTTNAAKTWTKLATPPLNLPIGAAFQAQLFTAPGGNTAFVLAHVMPQANEVSGQALVLRSIDGGATWTNLGWPTVTVTSGTTTTSVPLGGGTLATLGTDFAVDALGDAFIAPSNSDAPVQQDLKGPYSGGFFSALVSQSQWTLVASAPAPQDTTFSLAVSMTTLAALQPTPTPAGTVATTGTPTATATDTPTVTATDTPIVTATDTPTPSVKDTPTPTTTPPAATPTPGITGTPTPFPGADGLPTLWTNFGPLAQFTTDATNATNAGFFENILP